MRPGVDGDRVGACPALAPSRTEAVGRGGGILTSAWGIGWWVELAAMLLLAIGLKIAGAEGRRSGWILIGVAALLATVVPALSGHASAAQRLGGLLIVNDALHVAAAGAWLGGLVLLLAVGLPAAREADIPAQLAGGLAPPAAMLARYSRIALVSVALLLVTGLVSAWVQVGSWTALTASAYGRTLLIKLALVLPAALLGLYHWRGWLPRIEGGGSAEELKPSAFTEVGLALIVLAVTAVLALTPPPRSERRGTDTLEPPSAAGARP